MCNELFKELEKAINEELKANGLDIKIQVKGFQDGGFLTNISRTPKGKQEAQRLNEAASKAWDNIRKKWFKEF